MKRIVSFFIIFIFGLFFRIPSVYAESIQSFESAITVASDSSMMIAEKIIYDFGDIDRHGIFRMIPYTKINDKQEVYEMQVDSFSVRNE